MKRLVAVVVLLLALSGCSNSRTFAEKNGVCYRTEKHKAFGIQTGSSEVQSVPANCRGE